MSATQQQVNAELKHIPKGDMNQKNLRMAYNMFRLRDLSSAHPQRPVEVLRYCIATLQRHDRAATFLYDAGFFV